MKEEELRTLVIKYYEGDSTEAEEQSLREYFKNGNIPDGYDTEKAIFGYYEMPVEIPEPTPDFESRIIAGIGNSEDRNKRQKIFRSVLPYLSIAASLLILIASYFYVVNKGSSYDTYGDPAIAYVEARKILLQVSNKLNTGTQALEPVAKISEMSSLSFESINKSTALVGEQLRSLNYLQQAARIDKMIGNENE